MDWDTKHTMSVKQTNRLFNESAHHGEPGYGSGCLFTSLAMVAMASALPVLMRRALHRSVT
jgi:hypothetical protein